MRISRRSALGFIAAGAVHTALPHVSRAANTTPLPVVATFSIIEDLVANVGGDFVDITTIIDTGVDPHTFEPNPQQVVQLTEAALIFEIGIDFEPWLDDIYGSSGSDALRVPLSDQIDLLTTENNRRDESSDHEEGNDHDDHDHGEFDPHIWQNVANAQVMVEQIRDALIDIDIDNASAYAANALVYLAKLEQLDTGIMEAVETVPAEQRKLVTEHNTFGYYADRYGFEIVGTDFASLTTEGAEPGAGDLAAFIEEIEASGARAIFPENTQDPQLMEQIAAEAGVTVGPPLYTDALGEEESPGATYIGMMQFNTDAIVTALTTGEE